jgi:hypothetical protein
MLCVNFCFVPRCVGFNNRHFETLCLFHLNRRVDMKRVKLESLVVEAGTDSLVPRGEGGLLAGSSLVVDTNVVEGGTDSVVGRGVC